jgi:hypothetical protein
MIEVIKDILGIGGGIVLAVLVLSGIVYLHSLITD